MPDLAPLSPEMSRLLRRCERMSDHHHLLCLLHQKKRQYATAEQHRGREVAFSHIADLIRSRAFLLPEPGDEMMEAA